ncbi:hypothetical protein JHK85_011052 [Glycine max]|nr:hypothetical protein JHK85_011052 [Glycine max]
MSSLATGSSANIVSMVLEFLTELLGAQFPFVNSLRRTGKLEAGARRRVHGEEKERSRVQEFPKRPGDSECSYFLKTGHSRFKSNCKFHHPKDWIATLPPCNLNDKGVPLRPKVKGRGQDGKGGRGAYSGIVITTIHHGTIVSKKDNEKKRERSEDIVVSSSCPRPQ